MKKLFILICFFAFAFQAKSQVLQSKIETYVLQNSIDTFLVYKYNCYKDHYFDSCNIENSHYLIYIQKNDFFLKGFDYCQTYKKIKLDSLNPLIFYINNQQFIDIETIEKPTYFETIKKRKNKSETLTWSSTVSHSCYYNFEFKLQRKLVEKVISTYNLNFKDFDNGKENIYYKSNQASKLKLLIDLMESLIKEKKNQFEVE